MKHKNISGLILALSIVPILNAHITIGSLKVDGGATTLTAGTTVVVKWNTNVKHDRTYKIAYSKDGGVTWAPVVEITGQDGQTGDKTYSWKVPDEATVKGMLTVNQTQQGPKSAPPDNDYNLFTPVFTITAAATAIRATASAPTAANASLTAEGNTIAIRFLATESRSASVEVYDMNGTLQNTMALAGVKVGANLMNLSAKDLGLTGKSVLRLRVGGEVVVEELIGGLK
jgi:hypothetical protein